VLEVTACVDEPDELTSLEVYYTVWPHHAVTIGAVHSFRDSAQDYIDYLYHRARRATPTWGWHGTV
jgi:hypothetical protein